MCRDLRSSRFYFSRQSSSNVTLALAVANNVHTHGTRYVPTQCKVAGAMCKLHLSLHGCAVNEYYDDAVGHLGFQAWGEKNGIVVLFPRMQNHGYTVETTQGCWDAYGQTGADYACVEPSSVGRVEIASVGGDGRGGGDGDGGGCCCFLLLLSSSLLASPSS